MLAVGIRLGGPLCCCGTTGSVGFAPGFVAQLVKHMLIILYPSIWGEISSVWKMGSVCA